MTEKTDDNSSCVGPLIGNVLAIIVTYRPDSKFPERLKLVASQISSVLVIDNNSGQDAITMLREAALAQGVCLVENSKNVGIATALNMGIQKAASGGYSWALLFDQDTTPSPNLLKGLRSAYDAFPAKGMLAVIGANYIEPGTSKVRKQARGNQVWIERRTVITSGSLISIPVYSALGAFRDDYFIDGVDLEYCLRARVAGYRVIMSAEPLMTHDVGCTVMHRFLWKRTGTSNHSRERRYYMMRNQVDLAKRYFSKEPLWVMSCLWTTLKSLILIFFFEDQWSEKLKYAAMGLGDGLFCRFDRELA